MRLNKPIAVFIGSVTATLTLWVSAPLARAFTASDATTLWNDFNYFLHNNRGGYYYEYTPGGGHDTQDFWQNAELIEMAVDRAARSGSSADCAIVTNLINGFDNTYGTDWTYKTSYNDDIMWACLAHLRAWLVVPNAPDSWANEADDNFYEVFYGGGARTAPQYDSTYGGGMWWTTDHSSTGTKNTCVNCPGAIVAYYLYKIYGTAEYYNDGYDMWWFVQHYLMTSSGMIYDRYTSSGPADSTDRSYNVGTFIGASYYFGKDSDANLAANYFMNTVCSASYLPDYGDDNGDGAGFNGIFMRWMCFYEQETAQQSTYQTWLYNNANAAWNNRNASTGLSWNYWWEATPRPTSSDPLYSWQCSDSVVALQVLPPQSQ
ncbi:MAG: hypothetical protein ACREE6_02185 [Limisphaerales bacterium]